MIKKVTDLKLLHKSISAKKTQDIYILPSKVYDLFKDDNNFINKSIIFKQLSDFFTLFYGIEDVQISKKQWVKIFNIHSYLLIKKILLDNSIITTQSKNGYLYHTSSHAIHYRLTKEFLCDTEFYIYIIDSKKKKFIVNDNNILKQKSELNVLEKEYLDLKKVIIDEIEEFKKSNTAIYLRINRAINFNNNDIERNVTRPQEKGRIYTPICTLSRITRKHLINKYNTIDLKNSQPLMLVIYAIINNLELDINYKKITVNGKIYEEFYDLYKNDRLKTKQSFFKNIYYGFNKNSKINKRFKELFPLTWDILNNANQQKEYGNSLAKQLQEIEASIFLPLKTKYSTYTYKIHDSISFNNKKDKLFIIKQLNDISKEFNIELPISYEPYIKEEEEITNLEEQKIETDMKSLEEKETQLEEPKIEKEYTFTECDYDELIKNEFTYLYTHKQFRLIYKDVLNELVKLQIGSKRKIKEIIIELWNNEDNKNK